MGEPGPVISFGVDQAARSGWGIAVGRKVVRWGVATTAEQRMEVIQLLRVLAGNTLRHVYVLLEDHSKMHWNRLTAQDKRTTRAMDGGGYVQRSPTKTLIGLGDARGRWREQLELAGHPKTMRDQIDPLEWRRRMGIHGPEAKRVACRVAEGAIGMQPGTLTDDDLAEGVCLTLFAATEGHARNELRKVSQRALAKDRKECRAQTRLEIDHGTSAESSGRNGTGADGADGGGADPY